MIFVVYFSFSLFVIYFGNWIVICIKIVADDISKNVWQIDLRDFILISVCTCLCNTLNVILIISDNQPSKYFITSLYLDLRLVFLDYYYYYYYYYYYCYFYY